MTTWLLVLGTAAGCYLLKLAGLVVPASWLQRPWLARTAVLLPVAMLAALVAVQALSDPGRVVLDARVPAVGVAVILLWRGAPFLVVVIAAAAVAALLRLV